MNDTKGHSSSRCSTLGNDGPSRFSSALMRTTDVLNSAREGSSLAGLLQAHWMPLVLHATQDQGSDVPSIHKESTAVAFHGGGSFAGICQKMLESNTMATSRPSHF